MNSQAVYKNLDTSFVKLAALIKHLRKRQFIGGIKIELKGYNAVVILKEGNQLGVREHDELSGRVAQGEEALQRLLIRAREPGGTINVYRSAPKGFTPARKEPTKILKRPRRSADTEKPADHLDAGDKKIPKPSQPIHAAKPEAKRPKPSQPIRAAKPEARRPKPQTVAVAAAGTGAVSQTNVTAEPAVIAQRPQVHNPEPEPERAPSLPDFPFLLSNKFEAKAKKALSSSKDWELVLKAMVELLRVIDRSLAEANLSFEAEFQKVCAEISGDYTFLNPASEVFRYSNGNIRMNEPMNANMFISGIAEAMRRILKKLAKSRKYAETYNLTSQRLRTVIDDRAHVYQKFGVATQIRRILSP